MTRSSQLQETKLVSIKSGAYKLGVLEVDLRNLIVEHHIQVSTNYEGKPAISPNDLYKLAEDQCLLKLRNNYRVERYSKKKKNDKNAPKAYFKMKTEQAISFLDSKIKRLSEIHIIVFDRLSADEGETPIMANLLLYSKMISNSKAMLLLLKNKNWNVGSLAREIMECELMAKYFYEAREEETAKKHLFEWYRFDRSPKLMIMRSKNAYMFADFFEKHKEEVDEPEMLDPQYHFDLEKDLYDKKSKFTHSSFGSIFEVADLAISGPTANFRPNLGNKFREFDMYEITGFVGDCLEPIYSSFATFLKKSGLDEIELFNELRIIQKEVNEFFNGW